MVLASVEAEGSANCSYKSRSILQKLLASVEAEGSNKAVCFMLS
jgi:hypothetical protein